MLSFISSSGMFGRMLCMRSSALLSGFLVGRIVVVSSRLLNVCVLKCNACVCCLNVSMYPLLSLLRWMCVMCLLAEFVCRS